nr:mitochondrial amidoxime reducing component 2 [Quercus suber]
MRIQRIFIYPVKSLRPVEVHTTEITNEGLRFDRQYVLVKPPRPETGGFAEHITIKWNFQLGLFHTAIDSSWSKLTITHTQTDEEHATLTLPLTPSPLSLLTANVFEVSIFGTKASGIDMGDDVSRYFTHHLGFTTRLLYIGGSGQRDIPGSVYIPKHYKALSIAVNNNLQPQKLRFADAAPLLITTTASEEDARHRLPPSARDEDVIFRFRPNIHVDVGHEYPPYDEDSWGMLAIRSQVDRKQEVTVRCLYRTVRCLSLNVDLTRGGMVATNRQLYGLLARDRRTNENHPHKPVFGQYACAGPSGALLRVGDEVELTERVDNPPTPLTPDSPLQALEHVSTRLSPSSETTATDGSDASLQV